MSFHYQPITIGRKLLDLKEIHQCAGIVIVKKLIQKDGVIENDQSSSKTVYESNGKNGK